jgi:hypothetical protein
MIEGFRLKGNVEGFVARDWEGALRFAFSRPSSGQIFQAKRASSEKGGKVLFQHQKAKLI